MLRLIIEMLEKRKERKARIKAKLDSVLKDYNSLINDYMLIQDKKSNLSKSQRDLVVYRVKYLIQKGHITIK